MDRRVLATAAVLAAATASCAESDRGEPLAPGMSPSAARAAPTVHGTGGGHYVLPLAGVDLPGTFSFAALQFGHGAAQGHLRYTLDVFDLAGVGLADGLIDIQGAVTCVSDDPINGRLWVGGIVTRNASTQPDYRDDPTTQVGRDVWFRVVDYGEGGSATQPDRTTFVGFEGGAGIITSEEYCAVQPWPAGDERTNAVVRGNVQVH